MEDKTHLTAISRKKLSRPCEYLKEHELLQGRILDFGCGRGEDCDILHADGFSVQSYDPYYRPAMPKGKFDTIFCIYVLNVIPDLEDRDEVIRKIRKKLRVDGSGYVAVRGKVKEGWTTRGTWQGNIFLDLPLLFGSSDYRIYQL